MKIVIGIIVILIIIGIIENIVEWVKEHMIPILIIVGAIVATYFWGFLTVLKIAALIFSIMVIVGWISNYIAEKNEKQLNNFLKGSCMQLGYVDAVVWKKKLPQFADKSYTTNFESITRQFALDVEKKYITDDSNLSWLDPAANYLKKAFAADVWELEQIPSPRLEYTHCTPNGKLIQEAMEKISNNKLIEGKHLVQKIPLEAEAVCKDHDFKSVESVSEYYLHLYTISEYFRKCSINKDKSNIETEEISLDDL